MGAKGCFQHLCADERRVSIEDKRVSAAVRTQKRFRHHNRMPRSVLFGLQYMVQPCSAGFFRRLQVSFHLLVLMSRHHAQFPHPCALRGVHHPLQHGFEQHGSQHFRMI